MRDIVLKFDEKGLIPAIVQDVYTGKVLMLAYMNQEAFDKTLETKRTWFYSRSRKSLWNKGETSGNYQIVKKISYDCDADTLLVEVQPLGNACHTGEVSCFFNEIYKDKENEKIDPAIVQKVYQRIIDRKNHPVAGSYTNYLFEKGTDKILKKIGEEASEVIIGAKNNSTEEMVYEITDLLYHTLVLMAEKNIELGEIAAEMMKRYNK
ncbi:MAG: bifunctional phosphoribosyl-AMP cyclohydrolase/phosphoribosyl-ATP diphosphatase HisIE [Bacillota bacterium]